MHLFYYIIKHHPVNYYGKTKKVKKEKEKTEEEKLSLDRLTELKDDDVQLAIAAAMLSATEGYINAPEEDFGANYIFISTGMKNEKEAQDFRYVLESLDTDKKGKSTLYLTKEKIDPKAEKDSFESLNVSVYKVEGDIDTIDKVIFGKEELLLIDEDDLTLSFEVDTEDFQNAMLDGEEEMNVGATAMTTGQITKPGNKTIEIGGSMMFKFYAIFRNEISLSPS